MFLGGRRWVSRRPERFAFQRDYLQLNSGTLPPQAGTVTALYYMHAWEQVVSSLEDEEAGEVMLRGGDTSVRIRRMRRVEVRSPVSRTIEACRDAYDELAGALSGGTLDRDSGELVSNGRLRLELRDGVAGSTCAPCAGGARYLGRDNVQLRLMLVDKPSGGQGYVWSTARSALFRVRVSGLNSTTDAITCQLLDVPGDVEQVPFAGRVAEFLPFAALLDGGDLPASERTPFCKKVAAEVGVFGRVLASYDQDTQLFTVPRALAASLLALVSSWDSKHPDSAILNPPVEEGVRYFYLRLWHDAKSDADDDIRIPIASAAALGETGIVPHITAGRQGDYWYAALRENAPTRVVPGEIVTETLGIPPHGPKHFYAPIAAVRFNGSSLDQILECMPRVEQATGASCLSVTVGDGVSSFGDFTSIQAAIDSLPSSGGLVSVQPGFYVEHVRIRCRHNLVIEGCGRASVLENPLGSPGGASIDILSSSSIVVRGFELRSAEQSAVYVADSGDVHLEELHAIAGCHSSWVNFHDSPTTSGAPLFDFQRVGGLSLVALGGEANQRPALRVFEVDVLTLSDFQFSGSATVTVPPIEPQVTLASCALVRVHDGDLRTFGQVGLAIRGRSQDVEVRRLVVNAQESYPRVDGDRFETRSCIDVEGGQRLLIERCRLSMSATASDHAVLALRATDVVVRDNELGALGDANGWPGAYGGIEVRGGSERVDIRDNRIQGGVGHGITLGSVLWRPVSSPVRSPYGSPLARAKRRQGSGRGQVGTNTAGIRAIEFDVGAGFSEDDGLDYSPVDEGALVDVCIEGNRIQGMLASGISVLTVLGLRGVGGELVEARSCRILRNRITGNLRCPGVGLPAVSSDGLPFPAAIAGTGIEIPVLPFGGIVLASTGSGCQIRDNVIAENGTSLVNFPVVGAFVLTGEGIEITGNRIVGNGALATPTPDDPNAEAGIGNALDGNNPPRPGVRAGIAVMFASSADIQTLDALSPVVRDKVSLDARGSALGVRDNVVEQPEGRALHAVATGPVNVRGNFLSSQGFHGADTPEDQAAVGHVVFIQNLGMPWESFNIGAQTLLLPRAQRAKDWPSDKEYTSEQIELLSPTGGMDSPRAGTEEYFADLSTMAKLPRFLRNDAPTSPRFFIGEGGRTLFADNHVILSWTLARAKPTYATTPVAYFPVAIVGLDHVAVLGNQFGLRFENPSNFSLLPPVPQSSMSERMLGHVLAMGGTLDVSRNRIASGIGDVAFSLVSFAEGMSVVAQNQTTRDVLPVTLVESADTTDRSGASPHGGFNRLINNQVLFQGGLADPTVVKGMVKNVFAQLIRLPGDVLGVDL